MISKVLSSTISGFHPCPVNVEVSIQKGIPKFEVVGLGQSAVKEGRDRIMTSIKTSGFVMDAKRMVVNLAPASMRKDGSSLDLPIALGVLAGNGFLDIQKLHGIAVAGELSLDGSVAAIRGIFAMIEEMKNQGVKRFIIPYDNTAECSVINGIEVLPAQNLSQVVQCLQDQQPWPNRKSVELKKISVTDDWSDVKGQPVAKRAMEIAAAGGHHVLLAGVPGVGKTLLAKRFATILPKLTQDQELEVRKIQSLEDYQHHEWEITRPFRAPHHHASVAGIIGGGKQFRMGEFSLAHHGVLFMDEFPEFRKDILEALREPLEEGMVRISRAEGFFHCPAKFQLVAAMNLCPCGAKGDDKKECICTPWAIQKYRNKLSGPVQDRLDLIVELKAEDWKIMWKDEKSENSQQVRERVILARAKQIRRYKNETLTNASISSKVLFQLVDLDMRTQSMLDQFIQKHGMSLRSLGKVVRVARTIADLDGSENVGFEHVCEALHYRMHMDS